MKVAAHFVLSTWICCVLLAVFQTAEATVPYRLTNERSDLSSTGPLVDSITLRCRDINGQGVFARAQDVKFWLNRVSATDPDVRERSDFRVFIASDGLGIVFQLKRHLEGDYSCGVVATDGVNVQESARVTLIALQTSFGDLRLTAVTTFFAAAGEEATLRCPSQPGNLFRYYFGRWTRNGSTIIEIPYPWTNSTDAPLKGDTDSFDIDPRTFSLTIRRANVTDDASSSYRCVLSISVPGTGNVKEFTEASFLSISLMVNEMPSIVQRPQPFLVGLEGARSTHPPTFTCAVGGAPKPILLWTYLPSINKGFELYLAGNSNYRITFTNSSEPSGRVLVTSTITFLSVTNTDGGIVRCTTGLINSEAAVTADALLTILGTADDFNVFVTRSNAVIYELIFAAELQHPVTLNVTYTSENGESEYKIPDVRYNNTNTITYREITSELPYRVYHVSIALVAVNGSQRISGPSTSHDSIIDTTMFDPFIIAVIVGASVAFAILITCIILMVMTAGVYKYKSNSRKLKSIEEFMHNLPEKFLEQLPKDEREKLIDDVKKKYIKRVGIDGEEDLVVLFAQLVWEELVERLQSAENKEKFLAAYREFASQNPDIAKSVVKDDGKSAACPPKGTAASGEDTSTELRRYHPNPDVSENDTLEMPKYEDGEIVTVRKETPL